MQVIDAIYQLIMTLLVVGGSICAVLAVGWVITSALKLFIKEVHGSNKIKKPGRFRL